MPPTSRVLMLLLLLGAALAPAARVQTTLPPLASYLLPLPVAASAAALAAHADVLVLGERHGTQEVPEATASLLPMLERIS